MPGGVHQVGVGVCVAFDEVPWGGESHAGQPYGLDVADAVVAVVLVGHACVEHCHQHTGGIEDGDLIGLGGFELPGHRQARAGAAHHADRGGVDHTLVVQQIRAQVGHAAVGRDPQAGVA